MADNSNITKAQFEKLAKRVDKALKAFDEKNQDTVRGQPGQIIGFDADGNAIARDVVRSDWNVNNYEDEAHIKNRPIYEEEYFGYNGDLTLHAIADYGETEDGEKVYSCSGNDGFFPYWGEDIVVRINGSDDYIFAFAEEGNILWIGNRRLYQNDLENSGEPFLIAFNSDASGEWTLYTTLTDLESISIFSRFVYVKELDMKFIPWELKQGTNWMEEDENSPAFLHGKPFGSRMVRNIGENVIPCTAASSRDGNTLTFQLETEPCFDMQSSYRVAIDGSGYRLLEMFAFPASPSSFHEEWAEVVVDGSVLTATLDAYFFPLYEDETYSVTIDYGEEYEEVQTLAPKFLPPEVMAPKNWGVNDPNDPAYIAGRTHYEETTSEELVALSELEFSYIGTIGDTEAICGASGFCETFAVENGQIYVVQWPEFWVACRAYSLPDGRLYLGNGHMLDCLSADYRLYDSGEPFCIVLDNAGNFEIYTHDANPPTDLCIESEITTVVTLPEIFIPDTIARTEELIALKEQLDSVGTGSRNLTLFRSGWVYNSGDEKYPYKYELPVAGVTDASRADAVLDTGSLDAASECGISPTTETTADVVVFRSHTIPTADLTGVLYITKVADMSET